MRRTIFFIFFDCIIPWVINHFWCAKISLRSKALLISMTCDEQAKSDIEQLFDKKLWKNDQIQEHFVRFSLFFANI